MADIFQKTFSNAFLNENILISMKFIPKGPINNIRTVVQIMAWRRSGDNPLFEPMMVRSMTHICPTRSRSVKTSNAGILLKVFLMTPLLKVITRNNFNESMCIIIEILISFESADITTEGKTKYHSNIAEIQPKYMCIIFSQLTTVEILLNSTSSILESRPNITLP